MFGLFDTIYNWFKGILVDGILFNFTGMFSDMNARVNSVAAQVGQTPQGWNANIFNLIRNLSETVIIPIAGMILTFILCYELITMIIEKNNMQDFETFTLFKWIFKTFVAVFILTHTFDIVMFVFALAQNAVNNSASLIAGSLNLDVALTELSAQLMEMSVGGLLGLYFQSILLRFVMMGASVCVFLIIYGRMIEIYLTISIAPIPMATMINREWGSMGNNFLKAVAALAFQGFLIMVCIAIYAALLQGLTSAENIHAALFGAVGYSILLCMILFKTGSISKSLFSAS
jgi:hypothetical protein